MSFRALAWLSSCLLVACTTARVLPPRTAPRAEMPHVDLPDAAPPAGTGRVVLDVTDGPMNVAAQRIETFGGTRGGIVAGGPLCRTPCVTQLPYGAYDLYYSGLADDPSRGDRASLIVGEGVNVLLRAPGKYETPASFQPGPIVLLVFAGLATTVGAALLVIPDGDRAPAAVLLGAGVVSLGAGLVLYDFRADQQDGASTFFRLPAAARPPPTPPAPNEPSTPAESPTP